MSFLKKRADYTTGKAERIRSDAVSYTTESGDGWIDPSAVASRCTDPVSLVGPTVHVRPAVFRLLFDSQLDVCSIRSCTRGRDCYSLNKLVKCLKPGFHEHTGRLFSVLVNPCVSMNGVATE